jgi:two-component system, cell cycle response regulator DivK
MATGEKKILIIDDDSRNIFALSAYLRSRKIQCVSSVSAREGLDILATDSTIAVVLMDMMMPEMDGYEAIGLIRNNETLKNLPVIAVTAQAMIGDKEKSLEAGASAYISKPVNTVLLLQLIDKYLK